MKTMFGLKDTLTDSVETLKRHPMAYHSLGLLVTLTLYTAAILAVDAVSGNAVFPVGAVAVFFLPAVLRAITLLYWAVRDDVRAHMENHRSHKVA